VFATSDMMTLGVLQALRQAGRSVLGDVEAIGTRPPPTLCPIPSMGCELARRILRLGYGEPAEDHTILPVRWVPRGTA
jgi:DNA-binding LacI/PurR family transcriptional regulator